MVEYSPMPLLPMYNAVDGCIGWAMTCCTSLAMMIRSAFESALRACCKAVLEDNAHFIECDVRSCARIARRGR